MSGPAMVAHLLLERLSWGLQPRVPEPEMVMRDSSRNAAFTEAGSGILAFTYLYHALQIAPVIRPGDKVLDLACGPANQLLQIARLNPDAHFVGLDASGDMLDRARITLARGAIDNVELVSGDMTRLDSFDDASMDCVTCELSLHHLPDLGALSDTMREIRRVLKPGGGLYIADFGRFKRASTQRFFSEDRKDCQTAEFTQDYYHSLRAAFSVKELSEAIAMLGSGIVRHTTPLAPFLIIFKSGERRELDDSTLQRAHLMYSEISPEQRIDFQVLARWFGMGGFGLPCKLA